MWCFEPYLRIYRPRFNPRQGPALNPHIFLSNVCVDKDAGAWSWPLPSFWWNDNTRTFTSCPFMAWYLDTENVTFNFYKRIIKCFHQRRCGHVNLVSRANPANTLKVLLSYFYGLLVLHTLEHSRSDQMKCIVSQMRPGSQALLPSPGA
jgi:hypothetical protein